MADEERDEEGPDSTAAEGESAESEEPTGSAEGADAGDDGRGEDSDVTEASASDEAGEDDAESDADESSSIDAMGKDKYRTVIGGQYGASVRKRLLIYGAAVGVIVVVVIVSLTFVKNYDNRKIALKDTAPWTLPGATQSKPRDDDFPPNGPTNTIKAGRIFQQ